jgi:outer membrane protein OmpA-like peptidoglycan-associated protein
VFKRKKLAKSAARSLNKLLEFLLEEQYDSLKIEVHVHTDGKGSAAKLKTLAQTRGAVILAFFEEAGIDRDRFIVIAHGNDKPLTDKKDRRSRAKNNRVELRLHNVASGK